MADDLYELLEYVKVQRAVDFSAYRPNTIRRRLEHRLSSTGMPDFSSYLGHLKEHPAELDALLNSLTIKVSRFFRNPLVFEILYESVLPELVETFKGNDLRIWCAGCARGEEAYSVAILLKGLIKKEALFPRIFILGTDIDKAALEVAKKAVYHADSLSEVRKERLDRYFAPENGLHRLKEEVRSLVTLAHHDITTGKPPKEGIFSDYHLILCRNLLIYFNRDLQKRVLKHTASLLEGNGYLVLGEAESMAEKGFAEFMPHTKIYRKGS